MNNVVKDVHYSYIEFERFKDIMRSKLLQDRSLNDLKDAFKILDRDGSGSIDADEFRDVMRGLSANFSEEEIEKMVIAADVDGDK
jgi:calmodulin